MLGAPVVVLTNVGLEHTRWLGPTIADIAREKLAVVRAGATLVLGDGSTPEVEALAARDGARIVRPEPVDSRRCPATSATNFAVAVRGRARAARARSTRRVVADVAARDHRARAPAGRRPSAR